VADLTADDLKAGGWVVQRMTCWCCGHRWVSVHPVLMLPLVIGLECSQCGLMAGLPEG
jgi:transcription elongation factor Elf1